MHNTILHYIIYNSILYYNTLHFTTLHYITLYNNICIVYISIYVVCTIYRPRAPCQKYCPKIAYPRSVLPSDCLIKCKRAVW